MAGGMTRISINTRSRDPLGTGDPAVVRWGLILLTVAFLGLFIVLPAANVFAQAFTKGPQAYVKTFWAPAGNNQGRSFTERRKANREESQAEKTRAAIRMTLGVAAVAVPANLVFGLAAAWAVAKFRFPGRTLLISLIDLPFSVSPVVAGLVFVLLFGRQGTFGAWATEWTWPDPTSLTWQGFAESWWPLAFSHHYTGVIFTPLAIVLASIFVTFPFVARALIPLMESLGNDEELAARSLGARGWQMFRRVTLPNIKWGLLYGVVLSTARCLGEFGAVSVVSGHTDSNDTMPLRIEKLWNEYNTQGAFALASVLTVLALVTLTVKVIVERRVQSGIQASAASVARTPRGPAPRPGEGEPGAAPSHAQHAAPFGPGSRV